jgi:hypothetical protein
MKVVNHSTVVGVQKQADGTLTLRLESGEVRSYFAVL